MTHGEAQKDKPRIACLCAWCGRARNDRGVWERPGPGAAGGPGVAVTHGICPDCVSRVLGHGRGAGSARRPG